MVSQIVLVPLYLSHWSVETYGIWLAIQALVSVMSTIDFGHQEFLGYEFLRIGRDNREELSKYIWSGISVGLLISVVQILLILAFLALGVLPTLLGKLEVKNTILLHEAGLVLLLQGITWLVSTSITGLLFRALAPFGYYPRMIWWGLIGYVITALAPIIAVVSGGTLLTAGIVAAIASVVVSLPVYMDLFRLLRKEQIHFARPSIRLGYQNFIRSLAISGKGLLENARQQGARLVMSPLAGVAGLTAFSTMRTGANVSLQGLNTVINPLMPELMRFLHQRDQARSEAAFGTVWFVLVAIMAPAMVVLQAMIEPLYLMWTRGQIPFDPLLFATLSLSVLVYAAAQPAIAVVKGNNILKAQLGLSALAAVIVVGGIFVFVPMLGILGGGISLLLAEVAAMLGYKIMAQRWLQANGLAWPRHHFFIALTSVVIATASLGVMVWLPGAKWLIVSGALLLLYANLWRYWQALPLLATQHALRIVSALPGFKRLYSADK